ncbi:STCT_EMENI Putative sterigmatocystin biosynthesis protein stcT [Aspergillus nidulans FGSC A4]|uniref:Glutathione S-transferase stcT n=1 Tax=Emericella nidulans (strain FGSC A4 / ATCC 38163 / CBS 112.46 / NRRL 194 / M139) TaxID=227321 RepID=STCT_EMENI|nr:protein stcT [Aspergillus nidulans FGSC A4]Q00717.1 RecName: Full=Glutathione S-transferase stcT; AltName: Full=Sterigmatocystin biosynthesis cluster protein T [Aspergillus nidulans FGSC A4]AAC49204.1 putative translation elongation factor 1 gamma [Aspergillus nidulans]EAA61595.1 STCT_EMENI Putative sterigmatocystin biosynthesis protein stcT [Aspergillus nidulans FGSC A4]CBF80147.1 TPA: Putative sterigmatocystin biosynthesis protein stcT [Source:UniProtKB/Swiss-Prot;Acc:Q00717] [Aspergillus |eukprot:XP_681076.1 STCT_EMENI Putative sterigmatocystin biosynthesis protein stcT [Aspergillus nidulans FGSC A4]
MPFGTLYTRPFNPRSLAILAIAKANNLPLKIKTITSFKDATEEYLQLNPLGKIPTFVGADGYVLTESIAIALYDSNTTLLGTTGQEYASIIRWMAFGITEILPALGGWFNPLIGRANFNADNIYQSKDDTLARLKILDNHLCGREYLVGETLSLADLFVLGIVQGAFRFFLDKRWRDEHRNLSTWFERVHALPIVVDVAGPPVLAEYEMPIQPPK